jgi:excisionase family DNA binding protein
MPARLLSAADVAAWFNVNIETVYDLIAKHQLPAIKIGGQWRFQEAQVREWFEEHTAAPARSESRPGQRARGHLVCALDDAPGGHQADPVGSGQRGGDPAEHPGAR